MAKSEYRFNEIDLDSPGYEYLRSYQNMSNLYYKLVMLNYQKDFCSKYKCPPIHKYYFSVPSENKDEQQFIFTCLCAWLIKEKCQMNLELEPEEYEDPDVTIGVISEALVLLLSPDEDVFINKKEPLKSILNFPPTRLRQGFGPEVIWTFNILADRALELMFDNYPKSDIRTKVTYNAKAIPDTGDYNSTSDKITLGSSSRNGSSTTRLLDNCQIDDPALLFDNVTDKNLSDNIEKHTHIEYEAWCNQVEKAKQLLRSANHLNSNLTFELDWADHLSFMQKSLHSLKNFTETHKPLLKSIISRIDKHLLIISSREQTLQTSLRSSLESLLTNQRLYSTELLRNEELTARISHKTDQLEKRTALLNRINAQIEMRKRNLDDEAKLRELESMIENLSDQDD